MGNEASLVGGEKKKPPLSRGAFILLEGAWVSGSRSHRLRCGGVWGPFPKKGVFIAHQTFCFEAETHMCVYRGRGQFE